MPENDYVSKAVHAEFAKRIDDENNRQNQRIKLLEENVQRIGDLAKSVERLATNMENMIKEQEKQGKRLETLENRDGEMWRKVVGLVLAAVIGGVITYLFTRIGM